MENILGRKIKIFKILLSFSWQTDKVMRLRIVIGTLLVIISSSLSLSLPWVLKLIVDSYNKSTIPLTLAQLIIAYGLIWTLTECLMNLKKIMVYRPFERGINKFTMKVLEHFLRLPISYYHSTSIGNIMSSFERSQTAIPDILFDSLFIILPLILEITAAGCLVGYFYSAKLGVFLILIFGLYFLISSLTLKWISSAQMEGVIALKKISTFVTDILLNIEGVHYQRGEKIALEECQKRVKDREDVHTRLLVRMDTVTVIQKLIAGAGLVLLTYYIGQGVMKGELKIGDFILFNSYLLQFLIPLNVLSHMFRHLLQSLARMEDVMILLESETDITDSPNATNITKIDTSIKFEDVSFTYIGKSEPTIKKLNFEILAGKSTALIGHNGSGKTTISKLLYRLYDAQEGNIWIQNIPIKDIKVSSLRNLIGVVPQDVFMLNNTIYQNLIFGCNPLKKGIFDKVIKLTGLDEWVNLLPERYNTEIGEKGIKLSGGERQKIGIARTLISSPNFLILDEATSALDTKSSENILTALREEYKDITKLIITHDWRDCQYVDQVVFLHTGEIAAVGKHEQLLEDCPRYRSSWEKKNKK